MALKADQGKFKNWVIRTGCPGYRVYLPDLDPQTKKVKECVMAGKMEELDKDPLTRQFQAKAHAAESLPYTPQRAESTLWATADEHGDFIIESEVDAQKLWDLIKNDPDPKPSVDPRSPSLLK